MKFMCYTFLFQHFDEFHTYSKISFLEILTDRVLISVAEMSRDFHNAKLACNLDIL